MTLSEISYSVLETIREAHIVDDERISSRLIDSFVAIKRAEYLKSLLDKGRPYPENATQYLEVDIESSAEYNISNIKTSVEIPNVLDTRYGPAIREVSSLDVNQYNFTLVNRNHYKFAGNGKFNKNNIFVMYYNGNLYFKCGDPSYLSIDSCDINAIFEDPTDVPGFDKDLDDYPIDIQGIDFIKESIYKMDIRMLLGGASDEISDSTGEIKN